MPRDVPNAVCDVSQPESLCRQGTAPRLAEIWGCSKPPQSMLPIDHMLDAHIPLPAFWSRMLNRPLAMLCHAPSGHLAVCQPLFSKASRTYLSPVCWC